MNYLSKKLIIPITLLSLFNPISTFAMTKQETVYTTLKSNGEVEKTSINVRLKDIEKGEIEDYTNLENIKNVNGDEKFSKENEKITWKSTGKEIVYQGKISSSLPIGVQTKYYLNGEEKKYNDIKNKKGNIKIELLFHNNSYQEDSNLYTPFVVATIMTLPTKGNTNIQIDNGKIVNTGTMNVITGISSPGLYESTKIEELKNFDKITISYETEKFELGEVYIMATPKLIENADLNKLDKVYTLNNSMNTLQNGMNALENGSKQLNDGTRKLYNGLEELNKGLEQALDGSDAIKEGLTQINDNTTSISSLNILVDKLYSTYQDNQRLLNEITKGETEEKLKAGIEEAQNKKEELENQLLTVKSQIIQLNQLKEANLITEEQENQLAQLEQIKTQLEEGIKAYNEGIVDAQNNLATLPYAQAKLSGANATIEIVLKSVLGLDDSTEIKQEYIDAFKQKINTLVGGIGQLQEGSTNLTDGLSKLYEGSNQLVDGGKQLTSGSTELEEGISKINREGIKKLTEYSHLATNYTYRIKQLGNLSKNYKGFSSNNVDETIFIYKLEKK